MIMRERGNLNIGGLHINQQRQANMKGILGSFNLIRVNPSPMGSPFITVGCYFHLRDVCRFQRFVFGSD